MTKKWREFTSWVSDTKYSIIFGMALGGITIYIYTIDQILKDCKVLGMFRIGYSAFGCQLG